ncbi:hypothetical protein [Paenibacillus cymbidii]|uniref:hypothetical protein n=1 Tax=Paenibacillus cymbidii TaxID=1639034 RepID=UPI0010801CB0|nr:hypothetical protein [Paenibacillus cymbidii]
MAKMTAEERAKSRAKAAKKTKVTNEEKRLRKTYEKLPKDQMVIADGLIRRAAFMRVTLEEYEADLDENGYVEQFTQSEKTAAYERERPVARLYNSLNKNYQSIIKQLSDMLPKGDGGGSKDAGDDGFDEFVNNR